LYPRLLGHPLAMRDREFTRFPQLSVRNPLLT